MKIRNWTLGVQLVKKMNIFNGKKFAQELLEELKKEVDSLDAKPTLAVVSFGNNQSLYIQKKKEAAEFLGLGFKHYSFNENIGSKKFREELNKIVKSSQINSIVVQLPLPKGISQSVLNVIPPEKDPDLLSNKSTGQFFNDKSLIEPPTAKAIIDILEKENININNKRVSVFGYGKLVGRFLAKMLLDKGANVKIVAHPIGDEEIKEFTGKSSIIISAVGIPHFLNAELLPKDAIIIDAGFSTLDGKVVGDVNFETASKNEFRMVSPVLGGIGPVGVAILFKNIVTLYKH
jgi:methylenetetrahydrofolate dehydrogenase (NADP+)/methenyltetrahydrofolate cyclohydrolase